MQPKAIRLTFRPQAPRFLYSIVFLFLLKTSGAAQ